MPLPNFRSPQEILESHVVPNIPGALQAIRVIGNALWLLVGSLASPGDKVLKMLGSKLKSSGAETPPPPLALPCSVVLMRG